MIFGQPPHAGDTFTVEGRSLTCTGSRPHVTKDGRDIILIGWKASCAQCQKPYEFSSTLDVSRGAKRCRPCIDAQPKWSAKWLTPEQKKDKAIARVHKNAKISSALKAHHDRRLGRNEL